MDFFYNFNLLILTIVVLIKKIIDLKHEELAQFDHEFTISI